MRPSRRLDRRDIDATAMIVHSLVRLHGVWCNCCDGQPGQFVKPGKRRLSPNCAKCLVLKPELCLRYEGKTVEVPFYVKSRRRHNRILIVDGLGSFDLSDRQGSVDRALVLASKMLDCPIEEIFLERTILSWLEYWDEPLKLIALRRGPHSRFPWIHPWKGRSRPSSRRDGLS